MDMWLRTAVSVTVLSGAVLLLGGSARAGEVHARDVGWDAADAAAARGVGWDAENPA